jgi:hypothetical protein
MGIGGLRQERHDDRRAKAKLLSVITIVAMITAMFPMQAFAEVIGDADGERVSLGDGGALYVENNHDGGNPQYITVNVYEEERLVSTISFGRNFLPASSDNIYTIVGYEEPVGYTFDSAAYTYDQYSLPSRAWVPQSPLPVTFGNTGITLTNITPAQSNRKNHVITIHLTHPTQLSPGNVSVSLPEAPFPIYKETDLISQLTLISEPEGATLQYRPADGAVWSDEFPTEPGEYFVRGELVIPDGTEGYKSGVYHSEGVLFSLSEQGSPLALHLSSGSHFDGLPEYYTVNEEGDEAIAHITASQAIGLLPEVIAPGFTFYGWYLNPDHEETRFDETTNMPATPVDLYPRLIPFPNLEVSVTGSEEYVLYDGQSHTVDAIDVTNSSGWSALILTHEFGLHVYYTTDAKAAAALDPTDTEHWNPLDLEDTETWPSAIDRGVTDFWIAATAKGHTDGWGKGRITVKRVVTLEPEYAEKTYDGTELTPTGYTVTAGDLADGDYLDESAIKYTGARIVVGETDSGIEGVVIRNRDDKDVTSDYLVTLAKNTLKVTARVMNLFAMKDDFRYDGTSGSALMIGGIEEDYRGAVTVEYKEKEADNSAYTTVPPTNAGAYTVSVRASGDPNYEDAKTTTDYNILKASNDITIEKADFTYDGTSGPAPTIGGIRADNHGKTTIEYKAQGDDNSRYTATPPTAPDSYTVRVTVTGDRNYEDADAAVDYSIREEPVTPVETPEVPETPEIPEVPEIPETPEVPEIPEIPEIPETPEVPEAPEIPETPETPVTPELPVIPTPTAPRETPKATETSPPPAISTPSVISAISIPPADNSDGNQNRSQNQSREDNNAGENQKSDDSGLTSVTNPEDTYTYGGNAGGTVDTITPVTLEKNGRFNIVATGLPDEPAPQRAEPEPISMVTPSMEIQNGGVPQATGVVTWALINFLLMIATGVVMLLSFATYFSKRREDAGYEKTTGKRLGFRVATIATTIVAVVLFSLTENMSLPMVITDRYTLWHAVIAAATVALAALAREKYDTNTSDVEKA